MEQQARALGYAGAIPFVALAIAIWALDPRDAQPLLVAFRAWAAVILPFLGAVWWGLLLAREDLVVAARRAPVLLMGVVPATFAAVALLLPAVGGLLLSAAGFALFRLLETLPSHRGFYPPWYDRLRARLTWLVLVCHAGMATWAATGYHVL